MALSRTDSGWFLPQGLQDLPRWLLAPIPLALLQPFLDRIATHVAKSHPGLFARLEAHTNTRFLIDPVDLPFVLLLRPDAARPHLKAYRRYEHVRHDACIAGTFFHLLDLIEGTADGDALFFTRDLRVTGDTQAVVTLRNALDDLEGNLVETILGGLGPLQSPASLALSAMRAIRESRRHEQ
jgi:predicted lipid carrier protein YhbT